MLPDSPKLQLTAVTRPFSWAKAIPVSRSSSLSSCASRSRTARLELRDLLGRGVLRVLCHDLVDGLLQVARSHPHRYDPGVESDAVNGRPACRVRVRSRLPCGGHDPRDQGSMSERTEARAVGADLVAGAEIRVVVPDVARFELAFELRVSGIDSAVEDPERHALAGRTAGVGVVRLDPGEPVLVAELLVPGVFPAPLLFRLGIKGSVDRTHRRADAATRERQGENQDDGWDSRRPAGHAVSKPRVGSRTACVSSIPCPSPFRRRSAGNPSTTRRPIGARPPGPQRELPGFAAAGNGQRPRLLPMAGVDACPLHPKPIPPEGPRGTIARLHPGYAHQKRPCWATRIAALPTTARQLTTNLEGDRKIPSNTNG